MKAVREVTEPSPSTAMIDGDLSTAYETVIPLSKLGRISEIANRDSKVVSRHNINGTIGNDISLFFKYRMLRLH